MASEAALVDLDEILTEPRLQVILAFCKVIENGAASGVTGEKAAKEMVAYYTGMQCITQLTHKLIVNEVNLTVDQSTLFRRNSLASKILSAYSKLIGTPYIVDTLLDIMQETCLERLEDYEVDRNKMPALTDDQLLVNANRLVRLTDKYLSAVLRTKDLCPAGLRIVCRSLDEEVGRKFPTLRSMAIGGFFFLRFVCPAIIAPEQFGLVKSPLSKATRRILVLVSKVLQNISNGVASSGKETYMTVMNEFIAGKCHELNTFFLDLAKPCGRNAENVVEQDALDAARVSILAHLKTNIHHIGRALIATTQGSTVTADKRSDKRGFLLKRGENVFTGAPTWTKRWFLLRKNQLHYFRSAQDALPAGVIPLRDTQCCVSTAYGEDYTFEMITTHRTYVFRAASSSEMTGWVEAIHDAQIASQRDSSDDDDDDDDDDAPSSGSTSSGWVSSRQSVEDFPFPPPEHQAPVMPHAGRGPSRGRGVRGRGFGEWGSIGAVKRSGSAELAGNGAVRGRPGQRRPRGRGFRGRGRARGPAAFLRQGSLDTCGRSSPERAEGAPLSSSSGSVESTTWGGGSIKHCGQRGVDFASRFRSNTQDPDEKKNEIDRGGGAGNNGATTWARVTPHSGAVEEDTKESSGMLYRLEEGQWVKYWFVIRGRSLFQHAEEAPANGERAVLNSFSLLNAAISLNTEDQVMQLELPGMKQSLRLQAVSADDTPRWLKMLKAACVSATPAQSSAPAESFPLLWRVGEDSIWKRASLDVMESALVLHVSDVSETPSRMISVGNCFVRACEDIDTKFDVVNGDVVHSFRCDSVAMAKKVMVTIKKAKLSYWKKHQSPASAPSPLAQSAERMASPPPLREAKTRRSITLANPMSRGNHRITSDEPQPLSARDLESAHTYGYVMRIGDKAGRCWVMVRDRVLYAYKSERAVSATEVVSLEGVTFRYNTDSVDDLQFEIKSDRVSILMEAANHFDLHYWVTAINRARTKSENHHEADLVKEGALLFQDKNDKKSHSYWFVMRNALLRYYDVNTKTSGEPLGHINIGSSTVRTVTNPEGDDLWFECKADKTYVFRASSLDEVRSWTKTMKLGKLRYWIGDSDASEIGTVCFNGCGYLMKRGNNIKNWCRRWFRLQNLCLLYYKTPLDPMPLGEIDIETSAIRKSDQGAFRFEIELEHRTYQMEASSQTDLNLWMHILKKAKEDGRERPLDMSEEAREVMSQREEFMMSIRKPDKEGFLVKQGVTVKSWKRRWFVLKGQVLYYFTSAQISPGDHVGRIMLKDAKVTQQSSSKDNAFEIVTRGRIFFLKADTDDDLHQWLQAVEKAISGDTVVKRDAARPSSEQKKSGYLMKKGKSNRIWRQRFFVLETNLLSYYKPSERVPAGVIPLENCSVTISDESLFKKPFCFVISTRCRNYFVQARDQYEMACWIESIKFHAQEKVDEDMSANVKLFNRLNNVLAAHDKSMGGAN